MPRLLEEPVQAFAHCVNPRCPGHDQQRVDAVRKTTEFTYMERGGDMPGVESSSQTLVADDEVAVCPQCGGPRDLTEQPRVAYENISGKDPHGLLHYKVPAEQPDLAALQAENAALKEKLGDAA